MAGTETLLLDFDGPVCSVFAGLPAGHVAARLRGVLADCGHSGLPSHIERSDDPFDVFRYAATVGDREARHVEAALSACEVEAVASAEPTAGAHELIGTWGRWLSIVSNNSPVAIVEYLRKHDLTWDVDDIVGRTSHDPSRLKPSRIPVDQALYSAFTRGSACTLVGDSDSDIIAAQAAGCVTIGYANRPEKLNSLKGADLCVESMEVITRESKALKRSKFRLDEP
jgi:phosphoglycolate phosphatase